MQAQVMRGVLEGAGGYVEGRSEASRGAL